MKRLLYLLLFISGVAAAQTGGQDSRFEAKFGIGNLTFTNNNLIGGASTHITDFNIYGINGVFGIDKNWAFELGVSYIPVKYTLSPAAGLPQAPSSEEITLLSLPVKARYNIGKYFFLNAGMLIDFDVKNSGGTDKQSGFGLTFGAGLKYDLKNGIGVFINPEANIRGLSRSKKGTYIKRLNDVSANFGLAYSF